MARGSVSKIVSPISGAVSWRARWSFVDNQGVRRHRTETCRTRKEAEAHLSKTQHDLRQGTYIEASRQPTGEYMAEWFARSRTRWKRERTYHHRATAWRLYGEGALAQLPLCDLTPLHIQRVFDSMTGRGLGHSSVASIARVLNQALTDAVRLGLLARNPVSATRLPAPDTKPPRHWAPEEARRFLAATASERDGPMWLVMLTTAIRIGEALALRWGSVDLDRGTLRVERTISKDRAGRQIVVDGAKTDASRRTIALAAPVVAALRRLRLDQRATGRGWSDDDPVFPGRRGGVQETSTVRDRFARAVTRHGLPPLSPHGLRHTAATLALAEGIHPKVVQELLGHKSITMTLDLYSHVAEGLHRDASERIAAALEASASKPRQTG